MQKRRSRADRWWESSVPSGRQQVWRCVGEGIVGEAVQLLEAGGTQNLRSSRRLAWPEAAPNWRSVCEAHDPTGEPDAGNPHVRFGEKGVETDLWELELTPTRKRAGKCTRP